MLLRESCVEMKCERENIIEQEMHLFSVELLIAGLVQAKLSTATYNSDRRCETQCREHCVA